MKIDQTVRLEPALPEDAVKIGDLGPNEKWAHKEWLYLVDPRDTSADSRGRVINVARAPEDHECAESPRSSGDGSAEPFCACGRRWSECDGSRRGCRGPR